MQVIEKLTKQISETKYLSADNADRYRCIMRIFYENYEKLKYWMYQEDVYQEMIRDPYFKEYRIEQCQQDLTSLTEWKNLSAMQDTRKVTSIEEFNNKKFRYRMSDYSVEIERLVIRLENLSIEGSSLEPTLLEKLRHSILKFPEMHKKDMDTVYAWWSDLNNEFIRLNQNYQDYIRDLNSIKAEEMMKTKEFLLFKDKLVEYLRNFIKGLQRNVGMIEEVFRQLEPSVVEVVLDKVVEYELLIPRLEMEVSRDVLEENIRGKYQSIYNWFVGEEGKENEAGKLFDTTNEIIRRITRYATQLSERNALGANRKEEYRKAANIFLQCEDMTQAHKMAAMVFGMEKTFHLKAVKERETESMNGSVYEEAAAEITLKPRTRTYREKTNRSGIVDSREKKEKIRAQIIEQIKLDQRKIEKLEQNGKIDFSNLGVIDSRVREILLKWLSDALEDANFSGRTDDGREYTLDMEHKKETCVVHCEDGNFTMPRLSIVFTKGE